MSPHWGILRWRNGSTACGVLINRSVSWSAWVCEDSACRSCWLVRCFWYFQGRVSQQKAISGKIRLYLSKKCRWEKLPWPPENESKEGKVRRSWVVYSKKKTLQFLLQAKRSKNYKQKRRRRKAHVMPTSLMALFWGVSRWEWEVWNWKSQDLIVGGQ